MGIEKSGVVMSNVIEFRKKEEKILCFEPETIDTENYGYINKTLVKKPKDSLEYLKLCKSYLTEEDYRDTLCAILDLDYYSKIEKHLKDIVDAYYTFIKV
jgi:hypothetical protein